LVELDHEFQTGKPTDYNWEAILDLERLVPCVEGGSVLERTSDDAVKAEIKVRMGAMSMTFRGTVEVAERDDAAHRALVRVKSRDTGGQGYANADVTFALSDGGGSIHTAAQISGKAASMGEGIVFNVLDALINDFTQKLAAI
jgi:carbon monoxide dehydrogenase subunit G